VLKAPTVGEGGYPEVKNTGFPIKTSGMTNKDFCKSLITTICLLVFEMFISFRFKTLSPAF